MRTQELPELIPIASLTEHEVHSWQDLASRAIQPNPYFEAEFVRAAAEDLDQAPRSLAVVRDGSRWYAAMPATKVGFGRLSTLVADDHIYCFAGTPLIAADAPPWAIGSLLSRGMIIRHLTEGPAAEAIRAWAVSDGEYLLLHEHDRALLVRRATDGYLSASQTPRRRKEFRRQRRRLGEELGEELVCVDRSSDPTAIEQFLQLEASGWKGESDTAFASREGDADFLRRVSSDFRERGDLQLLSLEAAGEPVAMQVNLIAGETLFRFKIAFDEERAKWSPGALLEIDSIAEFHARTSLERIDSCADPEAGIVNRLWLERLVVSTVYVGPRSNSGRAVRLLVALTNRLRDSLQS